MTANFTQVSNNALNRTGGTMTGALLFSADNSHDIGASGATRPRDFFLGRNAAIGGTLGVTGASTLSSTLAVAGATSLSSTLAVTGAATLSSTLGVTGASTLAALSATNGTFSGTLGVTGAATLSGGVSITGTATATTFSGSGASLTSIPETALTDGSLLARLAASEIVTGSWTFGTASVVGVINLNTPTASNAGVTFAVNGVANGQLVQGTGGTFHDGPGTYEWRTVGGASRATLTSAGILTAVGGLATGGDVALTGVISPAALTNGNNNDYTPTGWSTTFMVRLTSGGASTVLTGLGALPAGTVRALCNVATDAIVISDANTNSSAANRFETAWASRTLGVGDCFTVWYDGASSRWRVLSVTSITA